MPIDIEHEQNRLATMTPAQLRQTYREVIGQPTRSGNRVYLTRRILWTLQAQHEGPLSQRAHQRAMTLADDRQLRLSPPKAARTAPTPAPGVPTAAGRVSTPPPPRLPLPGAVLTRVYKGRQLCVTVLQDGFEFQGNHYTSLSAIARAVTGTHWNGYHFFGLRKA